MNTRHRIAVAIAVAVALGAVGCADGDAQSEADATSPTEQAATVQDASTADPAPSETTAVQDPASIVTTKPDGPYVGSWQATLTTEEASQKGDGRLAGDFKLTLNDDGTYTLRNPLDPESTGRYEAASGDRLVFSKDTGCDMNFEGIGVYSWKITDSELTLTNVVPETGGCTGRTDTLTFPVWRRR